MFKIIGFTLIGVFLLNPSINAEEIQMIDLDKAQEESLGRNPELKAMEEDAKAAKAQIPQARSWDDPQIGVRFYQVPWGGGLDDAMDIDYIISQKFPFPGKKKAASQIAHHVYLHHLEQLGLKGREILRDLKSTYYSLYSVIRRLEVNQKVEHILRANIQGAHAKIASNQGLALDAMLGQAELSKILSEKEILKQNKISLEAKLNQLLFRESNSPFRIPTKLSTPSWKISLEQSLEIALQKQAKIRIAEHQIEENKWRIKAAKREFLPDMNAQLEYVQRPGNSPSSNLGDAWTGEFMFNIPLILKKKTKAVEQAEAQLASAQYNYSATKNNLNFQVKDLYAKLKSYQKILELNQRTLIPQSQQALDASVAAYTTGKADFTSLLNAARLLQEAHDEYWKNFENYTSTYSALEESIGSTHDEATLAHSSSLEASGK